MIKAIKNLAERSGQFFRDKVWYDPPEANRLHLILLYTLRVALVTARSIRSETFLLRSSALTYSTLLAVVPMLAIGFSLLKGMELQGQIEYYLIHYLTAGQEELTERILEYISTTDFKALGAVGTALLLYAVITMLSHVERAFNDIWGVSRSRTLVRKISDYISVLLLGPLLIVLSAAMITALSSHTVVQNLSEYRVFRDFFILFNMVIPHLGLWIAFTAIYILMPNTRVRLLPALIAGVICGSIWEIAFHLYTGSNIGLARYNKIYGTFAALPFFIIWIFISWVIVLVGAQISNAVQHIRTYQQEFMVAGVSFGQRQIMGLYIMYEIACRFSRGQTPPTAEGLALYLSIPSRLVQEIAEVFCRKGLLQEINSETLTYQPAMDLSRIRVADIFQAIRDDGESSWRIPDHAKIDQLQHLLETQQAGSSREPEQLSMADVVLRSNQSCGSPQASERKGSSPEGD